MIALDSISNIIIIFLFLATLWFGIYISFGTSFSGTDSSLRTTNIIFIIVLMLLGGIAGLIMVLQEIFFS